MAVQKAHAVRGPEGSSDDQYPPLDGNNDDLRHIKHGTCLQNYPCLVLACGAHSPGLLCAIQRPLAHQESREPQWAAAAF